MAKSEEPKRPRWGKVKYAQTVIAQLGHTKIYELINAKKIRSTVVPSTSGKRGTRLIDLDFLERFLEANATGGEPENQEAEVKKPRGRTKSTTAS
jgi:hypothetical protein